MTVMTEKQAAYRQSLRETLLTKMSVVNSGPRIAYIAIALKFPEPSSIREASEQIDALRDEFALRQWAKEHPSTVQPIMATMAARCGDKLEKMPRDLTGSALVAYIADIVR